MGALLWRLLHAIATLAAIFHRFLAVLWSFVNRSTPSAAAAAAGRIPRNVAVVVDGESAHKSRDEIAELLVLLAEVGVRQVALYDMEGVLKTYGTYLEKRVVTSTWTRQLKHDFHFSNGVHRNGALDESKMVVELLSVSDGKDAIVDAVRRIRDGLSSLSPQEQLRRIDSLTEQDINEALKQIGRWRPDPELMFVFGKINSVQGFPPWRIRLTEILFMGEVRNAKSSLMYALQVYSRKTHRYGC